jgi:hypothetical protein
MSEEHYLPAALGRFKGCEPLRSRVCRLCNKRIGDVTEVQFLRAGPIAFFRWLVGTEGRDGPPPSPFYRGAGGAPPLYMTGRPEGLAYDLLFEADPGSENVFPLRQVIFKDDTSDGHYPIPILDRMKNNPSALIDYLKESSIGTAKPVHIFAAPDEVPWVTDLLIGAVGTAPPWEWITAEFAPQRISLVVRAGVTGAHFRSIAKIAFHYVLKVFPDLTGHERQFDQIKNFIWEGGTSDHFVRQQTKQVVINFKQGYRPTHWSHFLIATRDYDQITASAQFFAGPTSLPLPYQVRIGKNPSRIVTRTLHHAHQFVVLSPAEQAPGYDGVMEDLHPANYVLVGR